MSCRRLELVEIGHVADQPGVEQLAHALVAQSADVHRATPGVVHDALEHPAGAGDVGTEAHRLVLHPRRRRVADRTVVREDEGVLTPVPLLPERTQHLGDDLAGPHDFHPVALADVLLRDDILVVQRGP